MRLKQCAYFVILIMLIFPPHTFGFPHYGGRLSAILLGKEPAQIQGYQLMVYYDPGSLAWDKLSLYFDGGFSHFYVDNIAHYADIQIYSAAPVLRYAFLDTTHITTFLEASIGLAYLNHTRLKNRNLGIHFAFQDRLGVGALIGPQKRINIGLHAVHYSNAHLSSHNSGLTALLVFDIGYQFNS
ncbi:MAG: acyloxyacyl hydrolase [Gammaproteobacteria bacterium]|nr:acyloxyacyl hydrolase [Gammaproteobacteria bacterium]